MKIVYSLITLCLFLCISCSSDDGIDNIGRTFEVTADTFSTANNFSVIATIPNTIEVLDSDVALVYLLDPIASANLNQDVWEPLPRTFFFDGGGFAQFQFNFIFDSVSNTADVEIFIESDNFGALAPNITQNQEFRIVIVPSTFAQDTSIDFTDIRAVQKALQATL